MHVSVPERTLLAARLYSLTSPRATIGYHLGHVDRIGKAASAGCRVLITKRMQQPASDHPLRAGSCISIPGLSFTTPALCIDVTLTGSMERRTNRVETEATAFCFFSRE